jgi:peptidoglycan biosynthesis protein MviN/MurJ (putative lipid II flippase)
MALNVKSFALASGLLWGLGLFVMTLVAAARRIGSNLSHISAIFIGYDVTFMGSVIGLAYGFLAGLIAGFLFALIYNRFLGTKT